MTRARFTVSDRYAGMTHGGIAAPCRMAHAVTSGECDPTKFAVRLHTFRGASKRLAAVRTTCNPAEARANLSTPKG